MRPLLLAIIACLLACGRGPAPAPASGEPASQPANTAPAAPAVAGSGTASMGAKGPADTAVHGVERQPRPESWSQGVLAAGTAQALGAVEPVVLAVPVELAEAIKGDTALFYFSPTCPHCQHATPDLRQVQDKTDLTVLGVATSTSLPAQLEVFARDYEADFDVVIDTTGGFARAVGARSTPGLYLARPVPEAPVVDGMQEIEIFEGYAPFRRGIAGLIAMRRHPADPWAGFEGYQSDATCGACHTQEATSWAISHHALAYRTLYLRERHEDQQCVGCHVTGWDKAGGFELGDVSSPLTNVSCEACHGPSGPHDGVRTAATSTCAGCHDAEHSIAFTVDKGMPWIDHYASASMSEEDLQRRLQEVANGEGGRPLLAFPEGPTVGSAACKDCHTEQHRWARKDDGHAGAMGLLSAEDAAKVECVACHATPQVVGPQATTVDAWRLDEGVGCESCHGPGGAHVEAPTADNIVGLGESCPECVIEAVCTSCHTPTWDPTWELKARLAGISH